MEHGFLFQAFIYLLAAVISVPVAKRLGLSPVLGYLLAGIIIGPFGLKLLGDSGQNVRGFAEFGVIMMLFLVGLELKPSLLWRMRIPILGLGSAQLVLTVAATWSVLALFGLPWKSALAIGIIIAMSSTAMVLQIFQERGWMKTQGGQSGFSVLLFQDLSVIPIMALLPLLAMPEAISSLGSLSSGVTGAAGGAEASGHGGGGHGISLWPVWAQSLAVFAAVAAVILAGKFLSRPLFRMVAQTHLRETFTAMALLLVISITLLMEAVGLSPALGAFLAGVVLADNEYRHELEGDIEPFKGLLLGLFFLTVGSGVDLVYVGHHWDWVVGAALGIMILKALVMLALSRLFRHSLGDGLIFALGLCQIGEFAFVLLGVAQTKGVLSGDSVRLITAVTALSMALTPLLILALDRLVLPRIQSSRKRKDDSQRAMEPIASEEGSVIIAGFGRVGNIVGRLLKANGVNTTVLDVDPSLIENSRKLGLMAHYGDASRLDLLEAAGIAKARLLVIAVDDSEKILAIAHLVRQHFPKMPILARATSRGDAYSLLRDGHCRVYRETFHTSLEMGEEALRLMGFRAYKAHRAAEAFRKHNEAAMRELAQHWGDDKNYMRMLREKIAEAEDILREKPLAESAADDGAWDNTTLREEANA